MWTLNQLVDASVGLIAPGGCLAIGGPSNGRWCFFWGRVGWVMRVLLGNFSMKLRIGREYITMYNYMVYFYLYYPCNIYHHPMMM